jgi:hypothetical protein
MTASITVNTNIAAYAAASSFVSRFDTWTSLAGNPWSVIGTKREPLHAFDSSVADAIDNHLYSVSAT